jgi:3D (Asp-Asp-Asp) domain-containing protein
MRKSTRVSTGIISALLISNITIGMSYVIDSDHYEKEILYQTKVHKFYKEKAIKLDNENKQNESIIDDLNKSIEEKSTEIFNLQEQLQNATTRNESPMRQLTMEITAYVSNCSGCSGFTYNGLDVRNTIEYEGRRIIAANFNKIPLYSIVKIDTETESFEAVVMDTGGLIKNSNVLDLLVSNYEEAIQFGRKQATVSILREGKG